MRGVAELRSDIIISRVQFLDDIFPALCRCSRSLKPQHMFSLSQQSLHHSRELRSNIGSLVEGNHPKPLIDEDNSWPRFQISDMVSCQFLVISSNPRIPVSFLNA